MRKRRRPVLSKPELAGNILERVGEHRFARTQAPCTHAQWVAAVGLRVASRAEPVKIERGVLIVKVASSTWAHELGLLAPGILERLRIEGVQVASLRFRVGEVRGDVRPVERRVAKKIPPPVAISGSLAEAIGAVTDDELRAILQTSAAANLAWQTYVEGASERRPSRVPPKKT